jgi:hypothetical protein
VGRAGRRARARARRGGLCAGYIAKYATKCTEAVGGLLYRLSARDVENLRVRPHVARMVRTSCGARTAANGSILGAGR